MAVLILGLALPVLLGLTVLVSARLGLAGRVDARTHAIGTALARRYGPACAAAAVVAVGCAGAAAVLAPLGLATRQLLDAFDKPIFHWVHPRATQAQFTHAMTNLTAMGNRSTVEVVVLVALLVFGTAYGRRWYVPVVAILAAVALQKEGQDLLTWVVPRTHPDVPDAGVFPSGGVSRLIAVYGVMVALALDLLPEGAKVLWRPRAWTGLALFAMIEAYTRLYLSLHWTTDVLTGLLFGGSLLTIEVTALHAATAGRAAPPADGLAPEATVLADGVAVPGELVLPEEIVVPDELLVGGAEPPQAQLVTDELGLPAGIAVPDAALGAAPGPAPTPAEPSVVAVQAPAAEPREPDPS